MERLVGLALSRFLSTYIKDFSSHQFKDWSLNDLNFKEDVIQDLIKIPHNLKLIKVTCDKIFTKIPWKNLGNEPIVLYANKVYVEVEETTDIPKQVYTPQIQESKQNKKSGVGFIDRILDNIQFEVSEIELKVKLLGKEHGAKSNQPPYVIIQIKDIKINSTNSNWEIVDLGKLHKVNEHGNVIMYKQVNIGLFTLLLEQHNAERVNIIQDIPLQVRIKTKKEYFRGPMLNFSVNINVLEECNISMHQQEFKALEDAIDAIFECFGRTASGYENSNDENIDEKEITSSDEVTSPKKQTMWTRFTEILGYRSQYNTEEKEEDIPDDTIENLEVTTNEVSIQDSEDSIGSDDEFFDCYEDIEDMPKEKATLIEEDEDVPISEFILNIHKGKLNIFEYILGEHIGIASFSFDNFSCHFIPQISEIFKSIIGFVPQNEMSALDSNTPLQQSKIKVTIDSYELSILSPGPEHHPDYHTLVEKINSQNSDTNMLLLQFQKVHHPENPNQVHKELLVEFDKVKIVFDVMIWENIYRFFFGSDNGRKLEQYISDNIDFIIHEAFSEQVHFLVSTKEPLFIIPPYAKKLSSKPHLASKVSFINSKALTFKSVVNEKIPLEFSKNLFTKKSFPYHDGDIIDCRDDDIILSNYFELQIEDAWLDIKSTPESASDRVINPIDVRAIIVRNELKKNVVGKPNLDIFVTLSEIDVSMNQSQYSYLLGIWGEKITWDPHNLSAEMKEMVLMEEALKAANSGIEHFIANNNVDNEEDVVLIRLNLYLHHTKISFLERKSESEDEIHYESIANIELPHATSVLELHQDKNVIKFLSPSFNMQAPYHKDSPFSSLISSSIYKDECLFFRMESYKVETPTPNKMWVKLDSVDICCIYSMLARILLFFISDEIPPEYMEEKVKEFIASYSFDQSPSLGMNWELEFCTSELIIVESPDTPECSPMEIINGNLKRVAVSENEIHYIFEGKTAFHSKMWRDKNFQVEQLTKPFNMKALYAYTNDEKSKSNSSKIQIDVENIDINISRNQLIMLQSILDNQLSDIRHTNAQSSTEEDTAHITHTIRMFYNSFQFNANKMKISLREEDNVFSIMRLKAFSYSTENWSDIWIMDVECDSLVIKSTDSSLKFKLLHPRNEKTKLKLRENEDYVKTSPKFIRISYQSKNKEFKGNHDSSRPWSSKWLIQVEPIDFIYDSEIVKNYQEFFSLMEEHKNLRKTYHRIQSEFNRIYGGDDTLDADTFQNIILNSREKANENHTDQDSMAINIVLKDPKIFFPENRSDKLVTLLELNMKRIRFGNDVSMLRRQPKGYSQYELNIKQARLLLHNLKIRKRKSKSIMDHSIQSFNLINPTNIKLDIKSKIISANRNPYVFLSAEMDSFIAMISLNRYTKILSMFNYYTEQFFQRFNSSTHEPDELFSLQNIEEEIIFTDKNYEFLIKKVKITLVSDYMEESDLIFIKMNDLSVHGSIYKQYSNVIIGGNIGITLNNLSYLKGEERFIDPFYFNLNFKMDHSSQVHELKRAEDNSLSVLPDEQEDLTGEESSFYIEFVIFSELSVYINKEILRHLFEIYNAYSTSISDDKSNELHSHFQYIIVNNTDDDIIINQKRRKEKLSISPLEEKYFVFPDPRLPKDIEIRMKLWGKSDTIMSVEVYESYKITMKNKNGISRDIYVIIEPSGLKRYIRFLSTHYITNETDRSITAHIIYPNINNNVENVITYQIASGQKIPIPNSFRWEVECKIVLDDEFEQVKSISLDRKKESLPITLCNVYDNTERTILMSKQRDSLGDKYYTLNIIFSPPLLISNLTGFPLEFCFPDMNSINNYQIDDDDSNISDNEYFGIIESESEMPFYVSIPQLKSISFKLEGYESWTPAISLRKEQVRSVDIYRKDGDPDKSKKLLLNVSITSRIEKFGRVITVNLPFLLVNFSDMLISIKQPSSKKMVQLQPSQRVPFSWSKGEHGLSINVGNTRWSHPIQLGNNSFHRIEVDIPESKLRTMILMETKVLNEYSRIIIFKNWLNIQNLTNQDFKIILNYSDENEFEDYFPPNNVFMNKNLMIPKKSCIQSCICPDLVGLTVDKDTWSTSGLRTDENNKKILLIRNKLNSSETVVVDIEVKNEENGSFLILKENKDPPYIIYNNTPFGLNFRRYVIKNSMASIGSIEPGSQKFSQYLNQKAKQKYDIYFIPPHDSVNVFDMENLDPENEVFYQVSVFIVDNESDNTDTNKDKLEENTSIHDPNALKARLKQSLRESSDALRLKRSTSDLKKERQKAHYKKFFSDSKEKWSESFSFNQAQSGFIVNFDDFYNEDVPNKLHVSLKPQGKTLSLTFSLPDIDHNSIVAQEYQSILFKTTIPCIEIIFEEERFKKEVFSLNINGIHAEYSKYSSSLEYFYLIFKEFDAYALFDSPEYPVLIIVDKSRLHNYQPNLLEFLMEWNVRDNRLFIEYLGVRVLPFILQLDGEVITYIMDLYNFLFLSTSQSNDISSTDPSYNERQRIIKLLNDLLNSNEENFTFEESNDDLKNIYLGKLEMFPVKIRLSVGSNDQHFPVISEARLSIDAFLRKNLNDSFNGLSTSISSHYTTMIWKKVYKIIGNMDIIASPVQNILKLKKGIVDFVVLPYEGLILDDTPGAFFIEFIKGTSSLLINLTDFFLTTFMKLSSSLSLLFQLITFDQGYQKMKLSSSRKHPTNIFFGFVHGLFELSISIFHGITDIVVLPYKETKEGGAPGFFIGIGKGIIGIPIKPIGGVFDLLSKTSEGALQSIGRGYIIQDKSKNDKRGLVKFRIEYI